MSSDDYFEDESMHVNSAFLQELDAFEAKLVHAPTTADSRSSLVKPPPSKDSDTIDYDNFFDDLGPEDLQILDNPPVLHNGVIKTDPYPTLLRQRTLFGDIASEPQPSNSHKSTTSGAGAKKVKRWDYSVPVKSKAEPRRAKADPHRDAASEAEGENEGFQNGFARPVPPSFKHEPDLLLAKHWIYPTNKPKRDYQFNIVRSSLFENSLVSLPTGLGKTFIAGVIMLNYYRWFPEGKVVFVAPTKPLVAQQIDACHKVCGIPGSHSIELTGQTPKVKRAEFWMEKRVFFMTPQTFLNDLKTQSCNPTDIVLLVIDEAHRGAGDHAYAQIVRYLMIKNGHFRILALTATPGSNTESVQKIIDALHISHIEIRDENSMDLYQYLLPKKITTHIIKMSEDINRVRDLLAKLMNKVAKRVVDLGLLPGLDVMKLHPYRCTAVQMEYGKNPPPKQSPFVFGVLNQLRSLAQAMGYLTECSMKMCYDHLQGLFKDDTQKVKKTKLASEPLFQDVIRELERQKNNGLSLHPKLDKLTTLALEYFTKCNDQHHFAEEGGSGASKMMVFANYRMVVDEVVEALNQHQPIIRATRFVGQNADKQGNKGIVQREQLEIIQRFKDGEFNVLVATSIGEEGLDIGEVDCIICYDAQKTPIRMLQRIGRTGRRRSGRVEVLLSESREESNWEKARGDYESVQRTIIRGDSLQLFADVERLLPVHLKPVCQETLMPIEEYARETKKHPNSPKGRKRKKEAILKHHLPPGAFEGFIPSSELLAKPSNKKRRLTGTTTNNNATKGPSKSRLALQAKRTTQKSRNKAPAAEPTLSQLDRELDDDSDDKDLELGIEPLLKSRRAPFQESPSVISICSSSPNSAKEEQDLKRAKKDDSWLLDSDSNDDEVHSSEEPQPQSVRPLVISSSPASSLSETIRGLRSRGSRQRRQIVSDQDGSSQLHVSPALDAPVPDPQFLDLEAEVSGENSSDEVLSDVERDSDRRFLQELSPSQNLTFYNQTAAYRQSLLTQVDPNSQVPKFSYKVVRKGPFGPIRSLPHKTCRSSSPNMSTDRYSIDSFLVEDEEIL